MRVGVSGAGPRAVELLADFRYMLAYAHDGGVQLGQVATKLVAPVVHLNRIHWIHAARIDRFEALWYVFHGPSLPR